MAQKDSERVRAPKSLNGLMSKGFANGLEDWDSILGRVIPKTQKMVLDASCLTLGIIR